MTSRTEHEVTHQEFRALTRAIHDAVHAAAKDADAELVARILAAMAIQAHQQLFGSGAAEIWHGIADEIEQQEIQQASH